ncbi:hypothetical protein OJ998_01055 [Solirubrobacter taibaiensis]|nr:hypothetical protein [Solirubrobacter taibaiensis]
MQPDVHESFASLDAILEQLSPYASPVEREALAQISAYLAEVRPRSSLDGSWGRVLRDSVTFAVMRRVSRESFYTARVIDLSARTINSILARQPYARVHVEHADRLDRPSIKALARAMLLLDPEQRFAWIWHFGSDPLSASAAPGDLYAASRIALLKQLLGILSPSLVREGVGSPVRGPDAHDVAGLDDMASELVMQNYDRCFLIGDALLHSCDRSMASEILRLTGLAAINVGRAEDALDALDAAEHGAATGRRAHLAYLQGLIESKRRYDLAASTAQYQRGLDLLASAHDSDADMALEHGWLLNGLALNEAILWRRAGGSKEHHGTAFALEREAFELVRDGDSAARIYLRFNLLANSALLMEMAGEYDVAIDIFHKTFDFDVDRSASSRRRWESTMGYRIGVLQYQAGRYDEAYRMLHHAAEQDDATESWPVQERIVRALAIVAMARGSTAEAEMLFRGGLEGCRKARAADGACEHARGLVSALVAAERFDVAQDVVSELREEEGIDLAEPLEQIRPKPPSGKLPAYFPEIDLEGVPAIDLNRYLGTASAPGAGSAPWRN